MERSNPPGLTSLSHPTLGVDHPLCVLSPDWSQPGFRQEHCLHAIIRMLEKEVVPHDTQNFKFMARGASPIPGLPLMQTPRTYESGKDH